MQTPVSSAYDEIAEWYDVWAGPVLDDDPFFPSVEALMGEVAGLCVCDLGCGNGRVARHLAGRGAHIAGIDISAKMLEIARRYKEAEPRGIEYLQDDASTLHSVPDGSFDGVVAFMSLMDMPELAPVAGTVARILRPGGWFVFATLHPCYHTARSGEAQTVGGWIREIAGYFEEGHWRSDTRTGPPGKVGAYHRTLSTYLNAMLDAGLMLERVSEPRATPKLAEARPVWAEVPAVLAARFSLRSPDWPP